MIALEIMWKGMAGIFVAVLVIMGIVYLMGRFGRHGSDRSAEQPEKREDGK